MPKQGLIVSPEEFESHLLKHVRAGTQVNSIDKRPASPTSSVVKPPGPRTSKVAKLLRLGDQCSNPAQCLDPATVT